jgi:hypothetical protein
VVELLVGSIKGLDTQDLQVETERSSVTSVKAAVVVLVAQLITMEQFIS